MILCVFSYWFGTRKLSHSAFRIKSHTHTHTPENIKLTLVKLFGVIISSIYIYIHILPKNDWILYSLPSSPVDIVFIIYTRSEGLPLSTRLYPPCQGRALATLDKEWWPWPCVAWHLWLVIKWMDGKDWSSHVVWKYQLLNVHQYSSMFNHAWFVASMCGKEHVKQHAPWRVIWNFPACI